MTDFHIRAFKLGGPRGDGRHAYINETGAFIGDGVPLLEKDAFGRWQPRPRYALEKLFSDGYGSSTDLGWRMSRFGAVARALDKGDVGLAAIALVHAEISPFPFPVGDDLRKEGPPGEPRDYHGRWTAAVGDSYKGNATFYGNSDPSKGPIDHFAGKTTASGKIMDPTAMDAAVVPGTISLGSTVKVTLDGHPERSVTVTITDTGIYDVKESAKQGKIVPIPGNRVIDLTPAAFASLTGDLKGGPASVTVTIVSLPSKKR